MKLKKVKKAAAAIGAMLLTLVFSSCMAMEQGLEFDEKGAVTVYTEISLENEMFSKYALTEETFFERIKENEKTQEYDGWNSERIEKQVDGKSHIGTRFYKNLSYQELNEMEKPVESRITPNYDIIETDKTIEVIVKFTYSGEINESEFSQYIADGLMKTTFSISTPYEIVSTNGEKSADGTTVTWDIMDVMIGTVSEKTLTVIMGKEAAGFSAGVVIALCAVIIIPVAALIIILAATRKPAEPKKEEIPYIQPENQPEIIPEPPIAAEEIAEEPPTPTEESNERKYCPNCGNLTERTDKFCTNCGEKLNR